MQTNIFICCLYYLYIHLYIQYVLPSYAVKIYHYILSRILEVRQQHLCYFIFQESC
jgi:hypothetical protein